MLAPRPHHAEKTKTALRRGDFTMGQQGARKTSAPRLNTATTIAEQMALFTEAAKVEPVFTGRVED